MSLSKIIRKSDEEHHPFTLVPLDGELKAAPGDLFKPVVLGWQEPDEPQSEEEVYEPPPMIPEEEAIRRIREAHAEGFREGRQQAEAELAKLGEALGQALLATGALRGKLMHEVEEDLLKLSVMIARKVMLRELSLDPGIMTALVQATVEQASAGGSVVVRLNPQEYTLLADSPQLVPLLRENPSLTLKPDPAVPPAGCLVETVRGNMDAGIDAQLDEIFRRLWEERNARREEDND
ncbi:hypothetical protein GMSM_03590 [Geomonas sp. Red276]